MQKRDRHARMYEMFKASSKPFAASRLCNGVFSRNACYNMEVPTVQPQNIGFRVQVLLLLCAAVDLSRNGSNKGRSDKTAEYTDDLASSARRPQTNTSSPKQKQATQQCRHICDGVRGRSVFFEPFRCCCRFGPKWFQQGPRRQDCFALTPKQIEIHTRQRRMESACLSVCLSVGLSVRLSVYVSITICLSVCLKLCVSFSVSLGVSVGLLVRWKSRGPGHRGPDGGPLGRAAARLARRER